MLLKAMFKYITLLQQKIWVTKIIYKSFFLISTLRDWTVLVQSVDRRSAPRSFRAY